MIRLEIAEPTPSLNTFNGRHWTRYHKLAKKWRTLVMVAKAEAKVFGDPLLEKSRICIERYGARMLDSDNLHGGAKAVIDSLKRNGLIVDDSPDNITLRVEQHIGRERKTVITLEAQP